MRVIIDDPELVHDAQKLAEAYGRPVEDMMQLAVKDSLRRLRANAPRKIDMEGVRRMQDELAALPILDTRSNDSIIGYNEFGHFDE